MSEPPDWTPLPTGGVYMLWFKEHIRQQTLGGDFIGAETVCTRLYLAFGFKKAEPGNGWWHQAFAPAWVLDTTTEVIFDNYEWLPVYVGGEILAAVLREIEHEG